jgi:hypothetical protein
MRYGGVLFVSEANEKNGIDNKNIKINKLSTMCLLVCLHLLTV